MKKLALILTLITFGLALYAQKLTVGFELRPRTEVGHGYAVLFPQNKDAAVYTSQRTRFNFLFESEKFKTKVVLQDVRIFGSQPQLVANEDFAASIHEAWGKFYITKNLSFKIGRMEIVYDDHRIFGNVGWAQQARSHDAAILKYKNENLKLDIGGAYYSSSLTSNLFTGLNVYKAMQFAHFSYKLDFANISLLALNVGRPENKYLITSEDPLNVSLVEQKIVYFQTFGFYAKNGKDFPILFELSAYLQTGKSPKHWAESTIPDLDVTQFGYATAPSTGKTVNAYQFRAEAGYKLSFGSISAGVERLSGDSYTNSQDNNNQVNAFNPVFGTNHKFNGWMDYFYVGGRHLTSASIGLTDIYLKFIYKKDNFTAKIFPHYFLSAGAWNQYKANSPLAFELDTWFTYKVSKAMSIDFGASYLQPTNLLAEIRNADPNNLGQQYWMWVMFTFKPSYIFEKAK